MRAFRPIRKRRSETGIALLIAIFVLLLISVVAIALIVSSNTESALAGNYRSSTGVYYAALAGVEEARARLRPSDTNSFKNTWGAFYPPPGAPIPIGTVGYVLNPSPTDNAGAMLATYQDLEYDTEFGPGSLAGANVQTTQSVWNSNPLSGLPFPGPLYKWVRINAVSEKSLNLDVDADGQPDSTTPLYYNSGNRVFSNNANAGPQALELTALAVLPNGSQKLLQYVVAPSGMNLTFPAALTLAGNNVQFAAPTSSSSFWINGADQGTVGNCNPGGPVVAVGYTNNGDPSRANILNGIPSGPSPAPDLRTHYTNIYPPPAPPGTPDVQFITLPPNLSTVAGLNALVQDITQSADVVINRNATQSDMPSAMSASNPMIVVINGTLSLNGWHSTGYGLLLVTGDFNYDPDASWDGIVLVIGTGQIYSHQNGTGQFLGAVFMARTVDASGNPLPSGSPLGQPFFDFASSGGNGFYYSSCWIQASEPAAGYKVLSFHEISQ